MVNKSHLVLEALTTLLNTFGSASYADLAMATSLPHNEVLLSLNQNRKLFAVVNGRIQNFRGVTEDGKQYKISEDGNVRIFPFDLDAFARFEDDFPEAEDTSFLREDGKTVYQWNNVSEDELKAKGYWVSKGAVIREQWQ